MIVIIKNQLLWTKRKILSSFNKVLNAKTSNRNFINKKDLKVPSSAKKEPVLFSDNIKYEYNEFKFKKI